MSGTKLRVMAFINSIGFDHIFTTRDLLIHGKRATVDSCISNLVKNGTIERLAWGVFRKSTGTPRPVSILEVAMAKARAFCRTICTDATAIAKRLREGDDSAVIFATDGRSTSFKVGNTRVYLRGTAKRKLALSKTETGRTFQYSWHTRNPHVLKRLVEKLQHTLPKETWHDELMHHAAHIPGWINRWLHRNVDCEKLIPSPMHLAVAAAVPSVPPDLFLREPTARYQVRLVS